MLGTLSILIIMGCIAYLVWFAWYLYQVEVRMTVAGALEWLQGRRNKLIEEVADEGVCDGNDQAAG